MHFCPNCNNQVDEYGLSCPYCGRVWVQFKEYDSRLVTGYKTADVVLGFMAALFLLVLPEVIALCWSYFSLELFKRTSYLGLELDSGSFIYIQILGVLALFCGYLYVRKSFPHFSFGFKCLLLLIVAAFIGVLGLYLGILIICRGSHILSADDNLNSRQNN